MRKEKQKPTFKIVDRNGNAYIPSKSVKPKPEEERVYLTPLLYHLQKIIDRPKRIQGNLYYSISSESKEIIKKLEKRWRKHLLNNKELERFYNAVNGLVVCTRAEEDCRVKGKDNCLSFLINLLEPFIKSEVNYFIKSKSLNYKEKEVWIKRAKKLVEIEILGDQINSPDRARVVKEHFEVSKPSENRHLSLVDRRIKSSREKLLNTIQAEDQPELVKIVESLLTNRAEGDDLLRFFKKSYIARAKAYDPYYLTLEEQNLLDDYRHVEMYYTDFNNGELEEFGIKTKAELDSHIEKEELQEMSVKDLISRLQKIPNRKQNIFKYLFSLKDEARNTYKHRRLYNRLRDLKRILDNPPRKIVKKFDNEYETQDLYEKVRQKDPDATIERTPNDRWLVRYTYYPKDKLPKESQVTINPTGSKQNKGIEIPHEDKDPINKMILEETMNDIRREIIDRLPSDIHRNVFELRFLKNIRQKDIKEILNRSKGRISQIVKDIKILLRENPAMKEAYREYCLITGRL
ncbi:sigma factor-like helix-turn-helix DNA-binding protein [Thermodesulfobacteriota bacterium]